MQILLAGLELNDDGSFKVVPPGPIRRDTPLVKSLETNAVPSDTGLLSERISVSEASRLPRQKKSSRKITCPSRRSVLISYARVRC